MKAPEYILATDCGSTTTKAILFARRPEGYRLAVRGEAPTTVEAPFADVTVGVLNAVAEVEELSGRTLLDGRSIVRPASGGRGVDLYISTSSAGGGLQMMVAGVVRAMTAESAERAALGAGAIVMDTIAANDRRLPHQQIERIRQLRPDMILLAGGVDGGTVTHVAGLAELIRAADPRPRLGRAFRLPVIFAGNAAARQDVRDVLGGKTDLDVVDNVRPCLEAENLGPAREKIHDLFMEHVMAQAPGYDTLRSWCSAPIMPTPGAVGSIIEQVAAERGCAVLGVDIGGATTDVFSVFGGVFNRTVSANVGMSYSVSNVLSTAGPARILRWLPGEIEEEELRNQVKNKMVRPTTIPQTLADLRLEQALAREAIGLAFEQHREFATVLKGVRQERSIADAFRQTASGESIVDMLRLRLIVGSGGVLSHAPRRSQAAMIMLDAFAPEGITELAVDSIFMMPHLGVLSTLLPRAATEIFHADCLVHLGTAVAPRGRGKPGRPCVTVEVEGGEPVTVACGELKRIPPRGRNRAAVRVSPARGFDLGAGRGVAVEDEVPLGEVGIVVDGRGRPIRLPADAEARARALSRWHGELDLWE
jgi:uncharacterized protein (TIGR01319 family)